MNIIIFPYIERLRIIRSEMSTSERIALRNLHRSLADLAPVSEVANLAAVRDARETKLMDTLGW